jgi:hypothetical protein
LDDLFRRVLRQQDWPAARLLTTSPEHEFTERDRRRIAASGDGTKSVC